MRLVGAVQGRVVFALPASPWLRNEWGTVHRRVLTLLAKSAATAAVQTTAVHGIGFTALTPPAGLRSTHTMNTKDLPVPAAA